MQCIPSSQKVAWNICCPMTSEIETNFWRFSNVEPFNCAAYVQYNFRFLMATYYNVLSIQNLDKPIFLKNFVLWTMA